MDAGDEVAAQRLFSLIVTAAIMAALMTALVTLETAISGDEPIVLLTLPLTSMERLWIAALRTMGDRRLFLVLTSVLASAAALVPVAPFWAASLLGVGWTGCIIGGASAICGVATWTRLASGRRLLTVAVAVALIGSLVGITTRAQVTGESGTIVASFALGLSLTTGLVVVNRAEWLGTVYVRAVQALATPAMSRGVRRVPGIRWLSSRRGATAAMIAKDVLVQSRDPFLLLRIVVTAAALPLSLWLRQRDVLSGWSDVQFVSCLAAALTIYSLVDSTPSPIGAEGERLTLWVLAPTTISNLLIAKLAVFLPPLLIQGAVMVTSIGVWIGMPLAELVVLLVMVALLVAGPATFLVLASASDVHLDVALERGMLTTLHEHVPHTPRRLWLLSGTMLLAAAMILLVWLLPPLGAMPVLAATDVAIATVCWIAGQRFLRSVIPARRQPV